MSVFYIRILYSCFCAFAHVLRNRICLILRHVPTFIREYNETADRRKHHPRARVGKTEENCWKTDGNCRKLRIIQGLGFLRTVSSLSGPIVESQCCYVHRPQSINHIYLPSMYMYIYIRKYIHTCIRACVHIYIHMCIDLYVSAPRRRIEAW